MSPAFAGLKHARFYPQLALWATICRQLRWLGARFAVTGCKCRAPDVSVCWRAVFGCGFAALCNLWIDLLWFGFTASLARTLFGNFGNGGGNVIHVFLGAQETHAG